MKYYKYLKVVFLFVFCASCIDDKPKSDDLKLTLLNKEVKSYVLKGDIIDYPSEIYKDKDLYLSKGGNVIEYKIHNSSKFAYLLTRVDDVFSLKSDFSGLSSSDILIKDSDSVKLWRFHELGQYSIEFRNFEKQHNRYLLSNYQNKNIDSLVTLEAAKINKYYKNNTLKIFPGETIYFKTFINLPNAFNEVIYDFAMFQFDYTKNYTFELQLHYGIHNKDKYLLSEVVEKNIKQNNFKVFEGNLNSEKIPIRFVE